MNERDAHIHRIIVVDDESIVLSLVRDALEDEGYNIRTAGSGHDALRLLQQEPADLLITDIRMPHMDGIELVRQVRKTQPGIGVIYMTGYANLHSAKDAIKQGAFDYILKPFELTEIRQAVNNAFVKLEQQLAAKSSGQKLAQLSDLNQMLLTMGDHKSLSIMSLRFVMMNSHTDQGTVLYWDREKENFWLITVDHDEIMEQAFADEQLAQALADIDSASLKDLTSVMSPEDHPFAPVISDGEVLVRTLPPWFNESTNMVAVPIHRGDSLYGLMMIPHSDQRSGSDETDLKLFGIAANQLALSIENLFLLEEARQAYARLKELQDETIQLEKMAVRGEMSAEIGHELNNFLGVVAGSLSLLETQLSKAKVEGVDKSFRVIFDSIERMKKFTSNLMDLTPIASRKEIVFFDKLLNEVIDYLKPQKRFQGVEITLAIDGQDIPFEADSTHIQQLLYNLFNNAADASETCETRQINVGAAADKTAGRFSVTISDTGVGIEPDLLPRLFSQKFTTKKNGHGFGLLVCKKIIDSHGGNLNVESTPGQGTSLHIDFPLAEDAFEPVLV